MAVINNTTVSNDLAKAIDIEFIKNFNQEYDQLAGILGIFNPEVLAAGTALYQLNIKGSLDTAGSGANYTEGDEVALSKYTTEKVPMGTIKLKPWRKITTADAINKAGYETAVLRTDLKMIQNIRAGIIDEFFTALKSGTGTATGTNLQAALANMDASLGDAMETAGDSFASSVTFINRQDAAAYLGSQPITTQTLFGMTYLESFLGVTNVFLTNKVEKGSIIKTPVENIHVYGCDFANLANAGLAYSTSANGLIGVAHDVLYSRVSAETNVLCGMMLFPEVKDYIIKGTIAPSA